MHVLVKMSVSWVHWIFFIIVTARNYSCANCFLIKITAITGIPWIGLSSPSSGMFLWFWCWFCKCGWACWFSPSFMRMVIWMFYGSFRIYFASGNSWPMWRGHNYWQLMKNKNIVKIPNHNNKWHVWQWALCSSLCVVVVS